MENENIKCEPGLVPFYGCLVEQSPSVQTFLFSPEECRRAGGVRVGHCIPSSVCNNAVPEDCYIENSYGKIYKHICRYDRESNSCVVDQRNLSY
jgi:hypothetical protein